MKNVRFLFLAAAMISIMGSAAMATGSGLAIVESRSVVATTSSIPGSMLQLAALKPHLSMAPSQGDDDLTQPISEQSGSLVSAGVEDGDGIRQVFSTVSSSHLSMGRERR